MPDETQVSSELVGGEGAMEAQIEMASAGASDFDVASPTPTDDEAEEFAERLVRRAASLSMVKINRGTFLRTEIPKYCPDVDAQFAVETTPAEAGVPSAVLDRIAQDAIEFEVKKCAGLSFLAGIPGGLALVGTVPADLAQYFGHVMRVEQKLAYVYGWQSFLDDDDEVDDRTIMELVVLMGVMMEVGGVASTLTKFAATTAQQAVAKTIERQALTKTFFYPVMKKVLRFIGISLTKQTFAKTAAKLVPVIGGAVSGGLTYFSFKPGAEKLKAYLRAMPASGVNSDEPDVTIKKIDLSESAQDAIELARKGAESAAVVASAGAKSAARFAADAARMFANFLDEAAEKDGE